MGNFLKMHKTWNEKPDILRVLPFPYWQMHLPLKKQNISENMIGQMFQKLNAVA